MKSHVMLTLCMPFFSLKRQLYPPLQSTCVLQLWPWTCMAKSLDVYPLLKFNENPSKGLWYMKGTQNQLQEWSCPWPSIVDLWVLCIVLLRWRSDKSLKKPVKGLRIYGVNKKSKIQNVNFQVWPWPWPGISAPCLLEVKIRPNFDGIPSKGFRRYEA